jgi:hypothetical protein
MSFRVQLLEKVIPTHIVRLWPGMEPKKLESLVKLESHITKHASLCWLSLDEMSSLSG